MAETHVISALTAKRAELDGELRQAEKRIIQLRADLESLDNTIRVFDPDAVPQKIRPVVKRKPPVHFRHGEFSRVILGILRQSSNPMTAREIAAKIASDYRIDVDSRHAMDRLIAKVRGVLARHLGGSLVSQRIGDATGWRAA